MYILDYIASRALARQCWNTATEGCFEKLVKTGGVIFNDYKDTPPAFKYFKWILRLLTFSLITM